uniref:Sulfate_transp domain-containing protein n=1 Tax=Heterorhabditis bacteriophora TaxID=37862 RepID=A0A1I7X7P5_HETBA
MLSGQCLFLDFSLDLVQEYRYVKKLRHRSIGTLGVLRGFIGTASTRKDRVRAVSLGTAGLTAGLSLGPAIQICFIPFGKEGFYFGPVVFNMYTMAAFFMLAGLVMSTHLQFALNILSVILANKMFVENYAGIISDDEKKGKLSAFRLAAPISIAMYNWTNEEAILYNGILQTISCLVSTLSYTVIGSTRLGKCDRRIHLTIGLCGFLLFHTCHYPWPFYEGPLSRSILQENGTVIFELGGCYKSYEWCEYTPRVPKLLYLFNFSVLLGMSFPLISAPCNTLLSEVIGPRKQPYL